MAQVMLVAGQWHRVGAGDGQPPTATEPAADRRRGWDRVINRHLDAWVADGVAAVDDDLIPPTADSVRTARAVAEAYRAADAPPPTYVVPNGAGGVTFERRDGATVERIESLHNGDVEWTQFEGDRLVYHEIEPASSFS